MARSLDQIIQELDAGYSPSRQLINDRIAQLPAQGDAQIAGLNAQKDAAFNDITAGARDRGMGFSGIPLGEQAKYTASNFLPAVAKVRQSQNDTQTSLLDALNNVNLDQRKYGMSIQQSELARDEQTRQFNQQMAAQEAARRAAAAAASASNFGLSGGGGAAPTGGSTAPLGDVSNSVQQRADKGFNFMDAAGHTVNAFQYAQGHGIPFRMLLTQMANAGDAGARTALNFVGDDGNADPTKVTNPQLASLYSALTGRNVGIWKPSGNSTVPYAPGKAPVGILNQPGLSPIYNPLRR